MAELRRQKTFIVGAVLLCLLLTFCFIGPLVRPTDQLHTSAALTNLGPGAAHPLGTAANGYDLLGRLMVGGRSTLEIALAVAVLATALGVLWGAVSGFTGGALDAIMMRFTDMVLALPAIFVLIYLASVTQPTALKLIVTISLLSWLGPARLIRGETLSLRTRGYVTAARAIGVGRARLIARHIVPNALGTILVSATFQVADAIILLATLSFLGFGLPSPHPSWGASLSSGVNYLLDGYWWEVYPAGLLIMATVLAVNLMGEGLRSTLDVRLTEH